MIAIVFIVAIGLLIGGASLFGVQVSSSAAASVPWWALGVEATNDGIACNVGRAEGCKMHTLMKKPMAEVKPAANVAASLQQHLAGEVLPGWIKRCGGRCEGVYNDVIAPITGIKYTAAK